MLHRLWRAETAIFLCVWSFLLYAAHRGGLVLDPSVFWHRVVGENILANGQFLRPDTQTDPFSFTFAGQPWIAQQWLAEIIMAVLYWIGGLDSMVLATATLLAALHAWVAHRLIRAGFHWLLGAVLAVLFFLGSAYHFHPRPHLVTIVLLGWTLARLCDVEESRRSLRSLAWLVPMFVLWTNLHGGMLGGLATVLFVVVGWGIARCFGAASPLNDKRSWAFAGALLIACALTPLINPYGLRLLEVWRSLSNSPTLREFIIEHQPLNPREAIGIHILVFALVYVAALAACPPRRLRVTWLIPLLWLCLAFTSIRHGPLFSITAAVALADVLPQTRWAGLLSRYGTSLAENSKLQIANYKLQIANLQQASEAPQFGSCNLQFAICNLLNRTLPYLLPAFLVAFCLTLQYFAVPVPLLGHNSAPLNVKYWPTELLPELSKEPDGTPVFNEMLYGGFVIAYSPKLRVFIDDRCELYGDDFIRQYFEAERDNPARVDEWADRYGFRLALVRVQSEPNWLGFARHLQTSPRWTLVKETSSARLYRRERSPLEDAPKRVGEEE